MITLFLRPRRTGLGRISLVAPEMDLDVRDAMDVWIVKETCLDGDYMRFRSEPRSGCRLSTSGPG